MVAKFKGAESDLLFKVLFAVIEANGVELRAVHIPAVGMPYANGLAVVPTKDCLSIGGDDFHLQGNTVVDDDMIAFHVDPHVGKIMLRLIDEPHLTTDASIETEIGHVGGQHLHIAAVVAPDG